jgi:hypothetical protein
MTIEQKIDLLGGINPFDVRGFPMTAPPPSRPKGLDWPRPGILR